MQKEYDYLFKLIVVGDSGVGKSSLLSRFNDNEFSESFISTIGVDYKTKNIMVGDEHARLQLWDTAGQERFRTIVGCYYRGAHGVVVVFDVTSSESFANVRNWLYEIENHCDRPSRCCILVGNKRDHPRRQVLRSDAERLAAELHIPYVETSAKTGRNVDRVFVTLSQLIVETRPPRRRTIKRASLTKLATPWDESDGIRLHRFSPSKKPSKCSC
uniref:Uncharacterized protein n=1 Tax=Plectus sambesii TaxID=2011161 RepID=A0A914W2K1_9BILA